MNFYFQFLKLHLWPNSSHLDLPIFFCNSSSIAISSAWGDNQFDFRHVLQFTILQSLKKFIILYIKTFRHVPYMFLILKWANACIKCLLDFWKDYISLQKLRFCHHQDTFYWNSLRKIFLSFFKNLSWRTLRSLRCFVIL